RPGRRQRAEYTGGARSGDRGTPAWRTRRLRPGAAPDRPPRPPGGSGPGRLAPPSRRAGGGGPPLFSRGTGRMRQRVAELAAFVDGARRFGRGVTRDGAGKGELPEQAAQSFFILGDGRIQLAVRSLQIGVGHHARPTVARTAHVNRIEVALDDRAVQ